MRIEANPPIPSDDNSVESDAIPIHVRTLPVRPKNAVKNIKLAATVFQNSKMETDARIWSDIIAELYGGDNAAKISEAFLKGKNQQFRGEFIVDVRFYKRPKANDHFIIVTSPQ